MQAQLNKSQGRLESVGSAFLKEINMNFHDIMFVFSSIGIYLAQEDLMKNPERANVKYCRFLQLLLFIMIILSLYYPKD